MYVVYWRYIIYYTKFDTDNEMASLKHEILLCVNLPASQFIVHYSFVFPSIGNSM